MQRDLAERFDEAVLAEALDRFDLDGDPGGDSCRELPGFENRVYEVERGGRDHILRIAHSARRTAHATLGEVYWLEHLARHGVPVAATVPSRQGKRVEVLDPRPDGSYFVAVLFERAEGEVLEDVPALKERYWGPDLFREWGRITGRMHRVSVGYEEPHPFYLRPHWHEYDVVDARRFVPREQEAVRRRADELVARLHRLPVASETYGMIHADLTQLNFCVKDGRITLFDFDNCERAWFVKDVAVALFYVAREPARPAREGAASRLAAPEEFLEPYLDGYLEEAALEPAWDPVPDPALVEAIPTFLELQRVMNYTLAYQRRPAEGFGEERAEVLEELRVRIEAAEPVVAGLDLDRLRERLTTAQRWPG